MQQVWRSRASLLITCALMACLAGCASAPSSSPPTSDRPVIEVPAAAKEVERAIERHRVAAQRLEQAQEPAKAATQWQIVALLAPNDRQAAERLSATRASVAKNVSEGLAAGRDALRKGQVEQAQDSLLRVLAFEPNNEEAANGLREIDRQRAMRRGAERAARVRIDELASAASNRTPTVRKPSEAGEFDIEQSLELLRAGNSAVAIPELRRYWAANLRDKAVRERIAIAMHAHAQQLERQGASAAAVNSYAEAINMHASPPRDWSAQLTQLKNRLAQQEYEQGVRQMANNLNAAIRHFEAALRYAPEHTQALLRLDSARKMQQNLKTIKPTT